MPETGPWSARQPAIKVAQYQPGWVKCPTCGWRFALSDRRDWSGHRHLRCGQRLRIVDDPRQPEPVWCIVANIAGRGTRHFAAGAKVYCFPTLWGDGWQRIKVVGKHRDSGKFTTMIVSRKQLTNLRVAQARSPGLLDRLSGPWDGTEKSRQLAESLVMLNGNAGAQ